MPEATDDSKVFQLKVTLQYIEPPIWRRLLVRGSTSLADLHDTLQAVFGWGHEHLHLFSAKGLDTYDDSGYDYFGNNPREFDIRLDSVLKRKRSRMQYIYDFGDNWKLDLVVEDTGPPDPDVKYPVLVAGERSGPPEDSGGPWGYMFKLEAIQDPKNPDHDDYLEWIGENYDSEAFDFEAINRRLHTKLPYLPDDVNEDEDDDEDW